MDRKRLTFEAPDNIIRSVKKDAKQNGTTYRDLLIESVKLRSRITEFADRGYIITLNDPDGKTLYTGSARMFYELLKSDAELIDFLLQRSQDQKVS